MCQEHPRCDKRVQMNTLAAGPPRVPHAARAPRQCGACLGVYVRLGNLHGGPEGGSSVEAFLCVAL